MGFFQDLKEDLSIAVDELATDAMPVEGNDKAQEEAPAAAEKAEESSQQDADMMPSEDLAKALEEAAVVQTEDAISPDGKPAPMFGEQMQLILEPEQEAKKEPEPAVNSTIEAAASELASIASIVNKEAEGPEEKKIEIPEEELTKEEAAPAPAAPDKKESPAMSVEDLGNEMVDENAVITRCMTVKGDILSKGSIEIIGSVEGNVTALGKLNVSGLLRGDANAAEVFADAAQISGQIKAEGTAKIGKDSVIIGDIFATSAVIAGAVKGDIDVHGPVILDSTAIVMGNIRSKSVQINNGAAIEGLCSQCYADNSPSSFFDKFTK